MARLAGWHKARISKTFGGARLRIAQILADASRRVAPELNALGSHGLPSGEPSRVASLARPNFASLEEGHVQARYRALDPVWRAQSEEPAGMIAIREHVLRLSQVANELGDTGHSNDWNAVSEHLHLAASLDDLSVDTDVEGTSFMCGRAAEFEDANSEVAAKYVAGVIVFNLVWLAYEWTVEIVSCQFGLKQSKGARGRDVLVRVLGDKHFPFLRRAVLEALELDSGVNNVNTREMRRLVAAGCLAGIGAEYLRV